MAEKALDCSLGRRGSCVGALQRSWILQKREVDRYRGLCYMIQNWEAFSEKNEEVINEEQVRGNPS